jgi:prepilin-type N-terminal cleavage/methylation domain-containing protein
MEPARRHNARRRGVTLIELLVVVSILLLLAVVTLPMVRPSMEKRNLREAARALNIFLGAARNRAIENGRPVGVLIERFKTQRNAGLAFQHVEIPPNYAGDTSDTKITLRLTGFSGGVATLEAKLYSGEIPQRAIRRGDLIQVNYQGPWYTVADAKTVDTDTGEILELPLVLKIRLPQNANSQWTSADSVPLAFRIARQPFDIYQTGTGATIKPLLARRSAAASLNLPRGVVVDLGSSGTQSLPSAFYSTADMSPVIIIFSPTGRVERLICSGQQYSVFEPIYFMVGKWGRVDMPDAAARPTTIPTGWVPAEEDLPNWLDMECFWLSLSPQSGLVNVSENRYLAAPGHDPTTTSPTYFRWDNVATWATAISYVRQYAQEVQNNKGGR